MIKEETSAKSGQSGSHAHNTNQQVQLQGEGDGVVYPGKMSNTAKQTKHDGGYLKACR